LAFSPDGARLVAGSDDYTLRLWDSGSGRSLSVRELDTPVRALAFSPDGRTLYTGNGNTTCYAVAMASLLES
jgi:WD40 repeat protein